MPTTPRIGPIECEAALRIPENHQHLCNRASYVDASHSTGIPSKCARRTAVPSYAAEDQRGTASRFSASSGRGTRPRRISQSIGHRSSSLVCTDI